jgi:hypothetical protein
MNKKFIYAGLLLPLVSYAQETVAPEEEILQPQVAQEAQAPEVPEVIEEKKELEAPQEASEEVENFDDEDTDLEQDDNDSDVLPEHARGNWYKKQQALKHAHEVYQEVRQKEMAVAQYEEEFITKKNILTSKLEEFSQVLGVAVSTLYQSLFDEIEKLEATQKPQGQMTQEERIKITQSQETKTLLLQLKKDFDNITELYKAADKAMSVLMEQITASHTFEQKAFENYEKISQVLSDLVAEQLYAEIVAARENINGISEYLKGDFSHYFDELSDNITQSLALMQQQLATLKERGVDLLKTKEIPVESKPAEEKKSSSFGFFGAFVTKVKNFFSAIISWFWGFFA